jgi:hypothetical protein
MDMNARRISPPRINNQTTALQQPGNGSATELTASSTVLDRQFLTDRDSLTAIDHCGKLP